MVCWYSYLLNNTEEFGEFQCEFEEFWKMFLRRKEFFGSRGVRKAHTLDRLFEWRHAITVCVVRFSNGETWLWSWANEQYRYFQTWNGWELVRRRRDYEPMPDRQIALF